MEYIGINELNSLCAYLNRVAGREVFSIEKGNRYVSWKMTDTKGSRIYLRAETARGLHTQMHAFKDGMYFAAE